MKLYDYYRSSASYRVRIALYLKNLSYEAIPIHLVQHGGEQHQPDYLKRNPQGLVPTLEDNGHAFTQSLAIIEYLEETHPQPALLPDEPKTRALIRSFALMIACDIHPLNNLRVLQQLQQQFHATDQAIQAWYHHWLKQGFDALETRLESIKRTKPVCYGDQVSLADICLVPQIYNARRFKFPVEDYPLIDAINKHCMSIPAFIKAAPEA